MQSASTTAGTVPANGPLPGIPRRPRKNSIVAVAGAESELPSFTT